MTNLASTTAGTHAAAAAPRPFAGAASCTSSWLAGFDGADRYRFAMQTTVVIANVPTKRHDRWPDEPSP